jgi:hypothetical protein
MAILILLPHDALCPKLDPCEARIFEHVGDFILELEHYPVESRLILAEPAIFHTPMTPTMTIGQFCEKYDRPVLLIGDTELATSFNKNLCPTTLGAISYSQLQDPAYLKSLIAAANHAHDKNVAIRLPSLEPVAA